MIRTERLLLRRWRDADREPFAAMNADPAVVAYLAGPMSRERTDDFIDRIEAHWEADGWGLWAVEIHGYATEAASAVLDYGFTAVGLAEIVSFTVPQNERSWRVMEHIGLRRDPTGDFDHPRVDPVSHPGLVRHVLYRLSREAWFAAR